MRVCGVGLVEGGLPLSVDLPGGVEVHRGGGVQPDSGVPVFVVVGQEEALAECAGVCQRSEPVWEVRRVFQGFVVNTNVEGGCGSSLEAALYGRWRFCWPSRVALRGEALNHHELHWLKTVVVSVVGKGTARLCQVGPGKMSDG